MILTSPAARGLLQAIIENPTDDVPRLFLADVLEEAGEGERAEFIRVQWRIATLDADMMSTEDCGHPDCPGCKERRALRSRERELLDREAIRWVAALGVARLRPAALAPSGHSLIGAAFRRGFVAEITCTVAEWCGERCVCCAGTRRRPSARTGQPHPCSNCKKTGRTGGHGPPLVLAAPIEEVMLSDRRPARATLVDGKPWTWFEGNAISEISPHHLPSDLFRLLESRSFRSKADALTALSRAALAWARQEAGLPALTRGRQ